ncbi:MAG TPA: hypothetical protein VGP96_11240, partial [Candidatus Dormibacteraeota bacterium]|nr:hypothetical protein [Candidatus Dormibacteraeota bacterium]
MSPPRGGAAPPAPARRPAPPVRRRQPPRRLRPRSRTAVAPAAGQAPDRGWLLPLSVVMIGSFMAVLDTSIVNVAIPTIQAELGASFDQAEWIAT